MGHLYVGRPRGGFILLAILVVGATILTWSRLVVTPAGYLAFMALVAGFVLGNTIHPALLARRQRTAPRRWYNRWWIYVATWLVPALTMEFAGGYTAFRHRALGFDTFRVASLSMSPTLEPNDFFLVDAWQYRHAAPVVGDVVGFASPTNPSTTYIKRIVGLPGDLVEIRDGIVYRNGAALREPYLHTPTDQKPYGRDFPVVRLAPDFFFILGDFRDISMDSRAFGPIGGASMLGPAKFVGLSLGHDDVPPGRYPRYIDPQPQRR